MKVVASTDEYTIYVKRSGRHGVRGSNRQWINGDEKVRILLEHKLIEVAPPKAPEPEPAEEDTADAGEAEATEAQAPEGDDAES